MKKLAFIVLAWLISAPAAQACMTVSRSAVIAAMDRMNTEANMDFATFSTLKSCVSRTALRLSVADYEAVIAHLRTLENPNSNRVDVLAYQLQMDWENIYGQLARQDRETYRLAGWNQDFNRSMTLMRVKLGQLAPAMHQASQADGSLQNRAALSQVHRYIMMLYGGTYYGKSMSRSQANFHNTNIKPSPYVLLGYIPTSGTMDMVNGRFDMNAIERTHALLNRIVRTGGLAAGTVQYLGVVIRLLRTGKTLLEATALVGATTTEMGVGIVILAASLAAEHLIVNPVLRGVEIASLKNSMHASGLEIINGSNNPTRTAQHFTSSTYNLFNYLNDRNVDRSELIQRRANFVNSPTFQQSTIAVAAAEAMINADFENFLNQPNPFGAQNTTVNDFLNENANGRVRYFLATTLYRGIFGEGRNYQNPMLGPMRIGYISRCFTRDIFSGRWIRTPSERRLVNGVDQCPGRTNVEAWTSARRIIINLFLRNNNLSTETYDQDVQSMMVGHRQAYEGFLRDGGFPVIGQGVSQYLNDFRNNWMSSNSNRGMCRAGYEKLRLLENLKNVIRIVGASTTLADRRLPAELKTQLLNFKSYVAFMGRNRSTTQARVFASTAFDTTYMTQGRDEATCNIDAVTLTCEGVTRTALTEASVQAQIRAIEVEFANQLNNDLVCEESYGAIAQARSVMNRHGGGNIAYTSRADEMWNAALRSSDSFETLFNFNNASGLWTGIDM